MDFILRCVRAIKEKGFVGFIKKSSFIIWSRHEEPADPIAFAFDGIGGIIEPTQVRSEITRLIDEVKKLKPNVILEIGTSRGGTAFIFSKMFPYAIVISIDLKIPPWRRNVIERLARIVLLERDSHSDATADEMKKILNGRSVDFLFIDGDHSLAGVKRDYELFSPFVKGAIGFHDILKSPNCHVGEFWNGLRGEKTEIVEDREQGWAGIGVIKR